MWNNGFYSFILLILFFFSCSMGFENKDEKIEIVNLSFTVNDEADQIDLWHIYFRNISDKSRSCSINAFDKNEEYSTALFPGRYNIYAYGLIEKTATTKNVFSYSNMLDYECFNNEKIQINLDELIPEFEVVTDDQPYIKIDMRKLKESFSLSSISLKQGSDRSRSLDFNRSDNNYCIAPFSLVENGDWFLNISYSLKDSKCDDDKLEKDEIKISTSYFSNLYLGEFNLL